MSKCHAEASVIILIILGLIALGVFITIQINTYYYQPVADRFCLANGYEQACNVFFKFDITCYRYGKEKGKLSWVNEYSGQIPYTVWHTMQKVNDTNQTGVST